MVYVYGICIWYMYMVYVYGICIWYMYMVTRRWDPRPKAGPTGPRLVTIYIYHIHIPYTYTIYIYHIHIPYTYTIYIYHIHMPYTTVQNSFSILRCSDTFLTFVHLFVLCLKLQTCPYTFYFQHPLPQHGAALAAGPRYVICYICHCFPIVAGHTS